MKFTDKKTRIFSFLFIVLLVLTLYRINFVNANPTYEDFTTYTEVDPNSHITKTANQISHNAYNNEDAYVYKDKGANYFSSIFTHLVTIKGVAGPSAAFGIPWMLSNTVDDLKGQDDNSNSYYTLHFYSTTTTLYLYLKARHLGSYVQDYAILSSNTPYYLTIEKSSTTLTCKIYTDAARTNLFDTLTVTVTDDSFQYIYGCNTYNKAVTVVLSQQINDLDLQEVSKSWNIAETWKLNLYTLKWFASETWKLNIYTLNWFISEIWKINIHNFAWFLSEVWNLHLHNYSWFLSENWLIYLHNFSWFNVENWKLGISSLIWNLAEIWKMNIYSYGWFVSEIWKLLIYPFNWFNVETWLFSLHNYSWFTSEIWNIFLGYGNWYNVEIWLANFVISAISINIALLYSILAIMIALVAVVFALSKKEK